MLELLKERFPNYQIIELDVDFWDIVNPFGKENIGVYEEKFLAVIVEGRELLPARSEYVVHFDTQHWHFEEKEDAFKYIESIMNDEICAIEFMMDSKPYLGGEIASSKLDDLTLDMLLREFPEFNKLRNIEFIIRSFSGKYDVSGRIEKVDGKYTLIVEKN